MHRWIGPNWIFQTIRAADGLSHQIQVTNIFVVNPFDEEATVQMVFWERRSSGDFERVPTSLFGGTWTMPPKWQVGYRPEIRFYRGSRYGWFEILSDKEIVPHASITYVLRRATDAGLIDPQRETTIPLQKRPQILLDVPPPPPLIPGGGGTTVPPGSGTPGISVPGGSMPGGAMPGGGTPGGGMPGGSKFYPGTLDEIDWELSRMVLEGRLRPLEEPSDDCED